MWIRLTIMVALAAMLPAKVAYAAPVPMLDARAQPTASLLEHGLAAFRSGQYVEARAAFRELAQRDVPAAETLLGTMAANGQGGPRDEAVAAAWFMRAARRGYAPAQLALADAFAAGRGVPQNRSRAVALARAAAVQGQPGAARFVLRPSSERPSSERPSSERPSSENLASAAALRR